MKDADSAENLSYKQQQQEDLECNVGIGEADIFDTEEIIGLAGENSNDTTKDILKELRESCVADNSRKNYVAAITLLIFYYYKFDKCRLYKS